MLCKECGEPTAGHLCAECADWFTIRAAQDAVRRITQNKRYGLYVATPNNVLRDLITDALAAIAA